jgi:hypothetical protein
MATKKTTISGIDVKSGAIIEPTNEQPSFNWLAIHSMALVKINAAIKTRTIVPSSVSIVPVI